MSSDNDMLTDEDSTDDVTSSDHTSSQGTVVLDDDDYCGLVRWHKGSGKHSSGYACVGLPPCHVPNLPSVEDLALSPVPEQLRCPICMETLERAVVLPHCGHTFCHKCITAHRRSARSYCPACRARIESRSPPPNLVARDLVGGILVHCDNGVSFNLTSKKYESNKGKELCPAVFSLERRAAHLATCELSVQYCEFHNDGCQEIVLMRDAKRHEEVCEFRSEWCHCDHRVRVADFAAHDEVCPGKMIGCQNAVYGCDELFPRGEVEWHLTECRFEAARPLLEANQQKQADLKLKVKELKEKVKDMKRSIAEMRAAQGGERNLVEKDETVSEIGVVKRAKKRRSEKAV